MSTYYSFFCDSCEKRGGFFSRQAWGEGNADIIATFKFLFEHKDCDSVRVVSEYSPEQDAYDDDTQTVEFVERNRGRFPYSDDWEFVGSSGLDFDDEWSRREIERLTKGKE